MLKCSSDNPALFRLIAYFPVEKGRSTAALDGKAVLYFTNSSFSFSWVAKVASMFLVGGSSRNDSAIFVALPLRPGSYQEFAMGGELFWRLEAPSNDLDPDLDRSSLRLSRLFCPNLGDLKKKKKEKRSSLTVD